MAANALLRSLTSMAAKPIHHVPTKETTVYEAIKSALLLSQVDIATCSILRVQSVRGFRRDYCSTFTRQPMVQVHGVPVSSHTARQLFMCALHKQHTEGKVDATYVRHACLASHGRLAWAIAPHALLMVGDDGSHALSLMEATCIHSKDDRSVVENTSTARFLSAAAFAVLRAPGALLPDRLHRFRRALSIVPATKVRPRL